MLYAYPRNTRCFVSLMDGTDIGELNIDFLPTVGQKLMLEDIRKVEAKQDAGFEFFTVKAIQLTALYAPTTRETSLQTRDISGLSSAYTILVERVDSALGS